MIATVLPLTCAGHGCRERVRLVLPGDGPHEGGLLTVKGWTAVVSSHDPSVVAFLCGGCLPKVVEGTTVTVKLRPFPERPAPVP